MPLGKQITHTHPRSGSLKLPPDQITQTFTVSMTATPIAQRCMGFKAPRAQNNEGASCLPGFSKDSSRQK